MSKDMMLWILISIPLIIAIIIVSLGQVAHGEDRYSSVCGMTLFVSPEEFLNKASAAANYDFDQMTPYMQEKYQCVLAVSIEDKAGVHESGSLHDIFD